MKLLSLLAGGVTAASALSVQHVLQAAVDKTQQTLRPEKYLVELSPSDRRWVTEDEKWALRRAGLNFMDVSDDPDFEPLWFKTRGVTFPEAPAYNTTVKPLAESLSKDKMHANLEKFTSFHTRYYKSSYGVQSATWLYEQIAAQIKSAGADEYGATVEKFDHPWGQFSIIARIPGQSNQTVVIGAHQDSINLFLPSFLAAPGADDDGSGTVTILEALRVLLTAEEIVQGEMANTVEFHWYSAEEGGLLGSQAIFKSYHQQGRDVKAMLQQDMTGYSQGTLDKGKPEAVGVITDFVDPALTTFLKQVITEYCDIPYVETKCGYACSDHASASKYGFASGFIIESEFDDSDKKIHTTEDKLEYLDFDHMLQHAKLTLGLAYELAFAEF